MRAVFMSWLPADMDGAALLDAGCGTGALSVAAARRGATWSRVDVAGNLVKSRARARPFGPRTRAGSIFASATC